jgi:D-proline reductase (dithiol) PrdB
VGGRPDSRRFLSFATRKLVDAWIAREPRREIPWAAPAKPLAQATVALLSTAALATEDDRPFDQEGERRDPWWGDPSFRVIPADADPRSIRGYHLHMDNRYLEQDVNCALPLTRLRQLERAGEVGRAAPSHYSYMGYILDPTELMEQSVPTMIERMRAEQVDVALLVPY